MAVDPASLLTAYGYTAQEIWDYGVAALIARPEFQAFLTQVQLLISYGYTVQEVQDYGVASLTARPEFQAFLAQVQLLGAYGYTVQEIQDYGIASLTARPEFQAFLASLPLSGLSVAFVLMSWQGGSLTQPPWQPPAQGPAQGPAIALQPVLPAPARPSRPLPGQYPPPVQTQPPELLPYPWAAPAASQALNPATDLYPPASGFVLPPPPPPPGIKPLQTVPTVRPPGATLDAADAYAAELQRQASLTAGVNVSETRPRPPGPLQPPGVSPPGIQPPPIPWSPIQPPGATLGKTPFGPSTGLGVPLGTGLASGAAAGSSPPPPPPSPPVTTPG